MNARDRATKVAAPEAVAELAARLGKGEPAALATVVETWGSSPVPVGGRMLITADGHIAGSVSGGCVEGDVVTAAHDAIADGKTRLLAYGVEHETAWRVGLPCGGRIEVLIERFAGNADRDLTATLARAVATRTPLVLESPIDDGARRLHAYSDVMTEPVASCFARRTSMRTELDGRRVFLGLVAPAARIVIVGATHIAQVLARCIALLGYETVVVDPRTAYATPVRFADTTLLAEWPEAALSALAIDPFTAVVALSHTAAIDDEALRAALASPAFYIGALGSKRNHAKRCERLAAAGLEASALARIRAPVGLDIGARTPEEIALSIAAEIVAALRGRIGA